MTEEERIIQYLKSIGAHEVTEEEKKQPWYKKHLEDLERWRKEEVEKPLTVHEQRYYYGVTSKRKKSKKGR